MANIYVGRQPVFDRNRGVLGYELLFRSGPRSTAAPDADQDVMTSQVILGTFSDMGLDDMVGSRLAFLNVTRGFLLGHYPMPLPADRTVLEVLEDVVVDDELLDGLRRLRAAGYRVALDDFRADSPRAGDLLDLAWMAKLDVLALEPAALEESVAAARERGVTLLAEKVETQDQFQACDELGFTYFQGYFLSRPQVVTTRSLTPSRLACLDLVSRLSSPDVRVGDVEALVRADGALSYRVLRAANAAWLGLPRPVRSIREAVMMLGLRTLRSWVIMMVMAASGDTHEEQLTAAMTRARMCELVAGLVPGADADAGFTVGLVSSLESVLGVPLELIVDQLPLDPAVAGAILRREGPLGSMLQAVTAYESGDVTSPALRGLDPVSLRRAYLSAVGWSLQTCAASLSA